MSSPNRKENYKRLRASGFTAKEATHLKDLKQNKIVELCTIKDESTEVQKRFHESILRVIGKRS